VLLLEMAEQVQQQELTVQIQLLLVVEEEEQIIALQFHQVKEELVESVVAEMVNLIALLVKMEQLIQEVVLEGLILLMELVIQVDQV
jgi:hypothetical protein